VVLAGAVALLPALGSERRAAVVTLA